jgi:hypothetical protein
VPVIPVRVTAPAEARPGSQILYQTAIELRRVRNRVVVSMYDPASGNLWATAAEIRP